MSILCLKVCRLCVPNIMNIGVCLKKIHLVNVIAINLIGVIFGVRFER